MVNIDAHPYPDNDGQTHWDGCWSERGHHNCAVEEVRRLRKGVAAIRGEAEAFLEGMDGYGPEDGLDSIRTLADNLIPEPPEDTE